MYVNVHVIFLKWFYLIFVKVLINIQKEIQRKISLLQLYNTTLPTNKEISPMTLSSARFSCLNKCVCVCECVCLHWISFVFTQIEKSCTHCLTPYFPPFTTHLGGCFCKSFGLFFQRCVFHYVGVPSFSTSSPWMVTYFLAFWYHRLYF